MDLCKLHRFTKAHYAILEPSCLLCRRRTFLQRCRRRMLSSLINQKGTRSIAARHRTGKHPRYFNRRHISPRNRSKDRLEYVRHLATHSQRIEPRGGIVQPASPPHVATTTTATTTMPNTSGSKATKAYRSPLLNGVLGAEPTKVDSDSGKVKASSRRSKDTQDHVKNQKRASSPDPTETNLARRAKLIRLSESTRDDDSAEAAIKLTNGTLSPVGKNHVATKNSDSNLKAAEKPRSLPNAIKPAQNPATQSLSNGVKHNNTSTIPVRQTQAKDDTSSPKASSQNKKSAAPSVSSKWPFKAGKPRRQGLSNPGAWCYRRALLQCLLSTPHFYNLLTDRQPTTCPPSCVPCALRNLTESYHRDASQTKHHLKALDQATKAAAPGKGRPRWRSNNVFSQEDTHEYLLFLLNSLDATACVRVPALRGVFQIAHRASWTCQDCHRTHTHDDPAGWSISLPIHAAHGAASLATCMDRYHGAARLTIRCDACKSNKPRQRGTRIARLPEVLVVHLLRFTPGLRGMRKNNDRVVVPDEVDVGRWAVEGLGRTRYRLNAMLYHSGGLDNGHYVARVKGPGGVELMDDASPPQRMQGWWDEAGSFTPYVLVFLRQ